MLLKEKRKYMNKENIKYRQTPPGQGALGYHSWLLILVVRWLIEAEWRIYASISQATIGTNAVMS